MDALIVGKQYYCSDLSLEKAESYKNPSINCTKYPWNGKHFVSASYCPISWDFWVCADDEPPQQTVTFPYIPGKKYLFNNNGSFSSAARIYVCTIGGRHYGVLGGQEDNYPNGQFEIFAWDNVIETEDVTEMTMEQVSSALREKGVITGTLKIKE